MPILCVYYNHWSNSKYDELTKYSWLKQYYVVFVIYGLLFYKYTSQHGYVLTPGLYEKRSIDKLTTDIRSTINTHNTELQMVKVHINNIKHITIENIYIPPRVTTSTHYKTADTDIQHCTQYTTNIPHSVLTGYVNAHSTLWHSYTDDHRGQLIADFISNLDHITLNTNIITRHHHGV